MSKWPHIRRIYWNIELFEQCMQYLLFQASHWSRSNGWDQFTKTKVSYKLVAKLFLCEHDVLFHFNPNWTWESLIEWIEWDLIFVGSCYCWSQIDIGGVRQYWTSICQVRSTTLQLWNNFSGNVLKHFNASLVWKENLGDRSAKLDSTPLV